MRDFSIALSVGFCLAAYAYLCTNGQHWWGLPCLLLGFLYCTFVIPERNTPPTINPKEVTWDSVKREAEE